MSPTIIQAIAHHEPIRNRQADPVHRHLNLPAVRLIQQHADLETCRREGKQAPANPVQGAPRVDNVVYQKQMASTLTEPCPW